MVRENQNCSLSRRSNRPLVRRRPRRPSRCAHGSANRAVLHDGPPAWNGMPAQERFFLVVLAP